MPRIGRYVELATGLHYQQDGEWLETEEALEIVSGAAVALKGQHKVRFSSSGAVELIGPDGIRIRTQILGLSYLDGGGRSVLIAEITNCVGELVAPNQVLYRGALQGDVRASVRFTCTRAGLEQDVILDPSAPPPPPSAYGLDDASAHLEVLTEFVEAPAPVKRVSFLGGNRPDETLGFGGMTIGSGRAFVAGPNGAERGGVSVAKQFLNMSGRDILVENVPYAAIKRWLERQSRTAQRRSETSRQASVNGVRVLPKAPAAGPSDQSIQLASAAPTWNNSFVIDYSIASSATNATFKADTTYLVTGAVYLDGTSVFEGGAVIKYATNGSHITCRGPIVCRTGPYRPVLFGNADDNTVGETISGSTGSPERTGYISLRLESGASPADLSYCRFWHRNGGIQFLDGVSGTVRHSQFIDCNGAMEIKPGAEATLRNCLIYNCATPRAAITGRCMRAATARRAA